MAHQLSHNTFAIATVVALLITAVQPPTVEANHHDQDQAAAGDPVVARVYQHLNGATRPIVLVVDASWFPDPVWRRVKNLVAFRLHRPDRDGTTVVDAATYLVRHSAIYTTAAATLRNNSTQKEYVWCLLAATLAHEAAHNSPLTERQALTAEAEQVRRCLFDGHLHSTDGWSPLKYLSRVEAKLRKPVEHY